MHRYSKLFSLAGHFCFRKIKIRNREIEIKKVENITEKKAIKRSQHTMTRLYADGSVGINTTLKQDSYYKIDGIKAKVWRLINGSNSAKTIAKKISQESKISLAEVSKYLPHTLNEFWQNGLLEKFDV